jgi:hypothetical protein
MIEQMVITIFPDVKAQVIQSHEVSWNQIVHRVTNPKIFVKKTAMPLLKLAKFGDIKTDAGSYRHDSNVQEVYGIEGDYDGEQISIEEGAARLKRRGITAVLYSSPSSTADKPRWRVLAPFSHGREPEERYHLCGMLNTALGGILARESFTLSQTYYFGSASQNYVAINIEGEAIDLKEGQWDPQYPEKAVQAIEGQTQPRTTRISDCIKEIYENRSYYEPALRLTAMYFNSGMSRQDAIATVKSIMEAHPNPNNDLPKYISYVDGFLASNEFNRPEVVVQKEDEPAKVIEWTVDKHGKIEATQDNLFKLLDQYHLRFDDFRSSYMITVDGKVRNIKDSDYTQIQYHAESLGFKKLSTAMVRENVIYVAESNLFDSAIEWGKSLVWDGVPRCHNLLAQYFGAEKTEYTRAASLYIATAMGGRLMNPGCKADAAIVLVGKQGVGKSMAVQALAPIECSYIEIDMSARDADQSRQLRGRLIGELSELKGIKSKDAESIKAWMSKTHEDWVPKYQEFSQSFPRRLTFWGTTNDTQFLSDTTGNRRFIPITVGNTDIDAIKKDRDQIWAEAIQLYSIIGIAWQGVQKTLFEVQKQFFDEDPIVDSIREYLALNDAIEKISSQDLWRAIHQFAPFGWSESRRLKRAMEYLGHEYLLFKKDKVPVKGYKIVTASVTEG